MQTSGLNSSEIRDLRKRFGSNVLSKTTNRRGLTTLLARFSNPLVIVLLVAASLSLFFGDKPSFYIITIIVLLSILLDFFSSFRSEKAADSLKKKVQVRVTVIRDSQERHITTSELVPGDVVILAAGKVVPADGKIIDSHDLFANEAALTGESFPQAKPKDTEVYMGSGIISGTGMMVVTKTGINTKFADITKALQATSRPTEFQKEIKDFSVLIIKVTLVLVCFVLGVNVAFHRNVLESILFSLALAVGLTPELLPLIITLNLTKGSLKMAHEGVIVKQLSAIQNFGSMDILCTDKTGTLTEDQIALVKYVDGEGKGSSAVLQLGYLVSIFSTAFKNPLDKAVEAFKQVDAADYQKIDEIPFDFERKREAVVVHHAKKQQRYLIAKGAPEEILRICTSYKKHTSPLTDALHKKITDTYQQLSKDGFRVLAVANRSIHVEKRYEPQDESNMVFQGFLAFLDPARESVRDTLSRMKSLGIDIKIITGDNALVSEKIAKDIDLPVQGILEGADILHTDTNRLAKQVEETTIFARVTPEQKMAIINALQKNGHVVGYMGDGINDAPSLRTADVGVSVNNAVDVAKDAADFILLRKDLHELTNGVVEGRRTFANTMKYLRMSLSSNFGNMFSMAGASLFLPFLPMKATQILLNNLLYDSSQLTIPLDNVDESEIRQPHRLGIADIKKFMLAFGLLSSLFDFVTFAILLFVFRTNESSFQSGWFIESMLTQVLVVYIIRTKLIPFKQSKPAVPLVLSTLLVFSLATLAVAWPALRELFHFGELNIWQGIMLGLIVSSYLVCAEFVKLRVYGIIQKRRNQLAYD